MSWAGWTYVDCIDTGSILPKEETAAEQETVENTAIVDNKLEGLPEAQAHGGCLLINGVVDRGDLFLHIDMVLGKLPQPAKVLDGLLTLAALEQPTRGFLDQEASNHEQASRDKLDRKGNDPLAV